MARHEFTALDGSRRWCSEDVLMLERHIQNYPFATFANPNRNSRDRMLKPKPSGFRWKLCGDEWLLLVARVVIGRVWMDSRTSTWGWNRDKSHFGSASDVANAMVDSIREQR